MRVVFRVDASAQLGTGHLMRCLALADELRSKGVEVSFICREPSEHLCDDVERKRDYRLHRLTQAAPQSDAEETKSILSRERRVDWLIVDHYGLDAQWEQQMRPYVRKIMVIDDLANRPHDCDLLLDQNFYIDMHARYENLLPNQCRKLLGPEYALLRREFKAARKDLKERNGKIRRILISFGGSDPTNETLKVLQAIRLLKRNDISIDVIVGIESPNKEQVKKICSQMQHATFHCQVENMAYFMANADLVVGAGGVSMWERCFLGLPSIVVVTAQNQKDAASAAAKSGAIWNLGWHENVDPAMLASTIHRALNSPNDIKRMAERAIRLMENAETSKDSRVVEFLIEKPVLKREHYRLRPITEEDLEKVLTWRNSERIRANMYTDHIISEFEHKEWFQKINNDPAVACMLYEIKGVPAGVIHYTNIDRRNQKCEWGFYLGDPDLPKGTGIIMGYLGVEYAFENMGIRKLYGEAFAFNRASIKFHRKLGFVQEGRLTKHIRKNGQYEDVLLFGLQHEKWLSFKAQLAHCVFHIPNE
ncbi:UDP-2,4-diacetamido-2,4,6-trideoxy-beta-L-altropyranose hydrolase [Ferviditalea candida]|uniref:UDP-2,4-diacetamido-2,4, 6-trideoxy-beta-L-altropyranose hydrolase n=1 Tax=Ferviditalea candida TaxID=3108399 RepID=A0ABU5ZI88_9BACL|nr:UDP-2,4-diacetamido-2,4,6-trideoxy-beta-L-altropyranose hydrolase [Paenibacillaceae bacterium T2]